MKKEEFLNKLRDELENANINNVEDIIEYYEEMIDDRIDDGMTEKKAVASIDGIDTIVKNELLDRPMATIIKEKVKDEAEKAEKNGTKTLWLVLLIIGIPVWFPLIIGLLGGLFGLCCGVWGIIIALFATILGLSVAAIACIGTGLISIFTMPTSMTLATITAGIILAGVSMILIPLAVTIAKGMISVIKRLFKAIKGLFV